MMSTSERVALRAPIQVTPTEIEVLKTIPVEQRSVTQLVIGLELMLENIRRLPRHHELDNVIGQNYDQHLAQLQRRGYDKMHHFYTVEYRAVRLRHL